ncbi:MAG: hypothetical protein QOH97_3721 [Actinoplanes sp.]|nr:hypothetical protein [Actinoplanes sp.]
MRQERLGVGTVAGRVRLRRGPLYAAVVVLLLAEMAFAMVTAALQQTPTTDEPVYVGTAVVYLQQHSLRYNAEHPPLGKLIMEAGLAFAHPRLDPGFVGDHWALGKHLLYESGNDPWRLMFLARLPIIVLTLLFGLVVLAFARDLTGPAGGLIALTLYAFSPDLITHGSLATLDVPAAGFLVTALWLTWRARDRPRRYLPLAGLALGAALATRMSVLPAVPVVLVLAAVAVLSRPAALPGSTASTGSTVLSASAALAASAALPVSATPQGSRRRAWLRGLVVAGGVGVIATAVVWASYLAVDPRLTWVTPADLPAVHGLRALAADLVPFPAPYRDGMRIQFGIEDATFDGFLFGRLYQGSLWYYLPAALLVKTPLGALALWLAGGATMLRRLRTATAYVLLPALVLLLAALPGARDFGVRYVIVLPMLLAVAASAAALWRPRWARVATLALLAFVAVSSIRTYPYYLPYSNEAFGGPAKTYLRLHDSNSDWGQDLGRLADRLRERYPADRIWLVYKGNGVPAYYGIVAADPTTVPPDQVHGIVAISDDAIDKAGPGLKALIASSTPVDTVGHSITIFRR